MRRPWVWLAASMAVALGASCNLLVGNDHVQLTTGSGGTGGGAPVSAASASSSGDGGVTGHYVCAWASPVALDLGTTGTLTIGALASGGDVVWIGGSYNGTMAMVASKDVDGFLAMVDTDTGALTGHRFFTDPMGQPNKAQAVELIAASSGSVAVAGTFEDGVAVDACMETSFSPKAIFGASFAPNSVCAMATLFDTMEADEVHALSLYQSGLIAAGSDQAKTKVYIQAVPDLTNPATPHVLDQPELTDIRFHAALLSTSRFALAGEFTGSLSIDGGNSPDGQFGFLLEYDPSLATLSLLSSTFIGGGTYQSVNAIVEGPKGVVMAGTYMGVAALIDETIPLPASAGKGMFVASRSELFASVQGSGDISPKALLRRGAETLIVVGHYTGDLNGAPPGDPNRSRVFLMRGAGDPLHVDVAGDSNADITVIGAASLETDDAVILAGTFNGPLDLGSTCKIDADAGPGASFVARFDWVQ